MKKKKSVFPSLFSFLSRSLPHSKELDKQKKNKERQSDSWGNLRTQINACLLHWLVGDRTFGFEFRSQNIEEKKISCKAVFMR